MAKHGRGFSRQGLQKMRAFYLGWEICPTPSGKFEIGEIGTRRNRDRLLSGLGKNDLGKRPAVFEWPKICVIA
jgi:hypothetical protein